MAVDIKAGEIGVLEAMIIRVVDVALDGSYPTGGYPINPLLYGLRKVRGVVPNHSGGYVAEWDYANNKLKVYRVNTTAAAMSEVPNGTSLAGVTLRLLLIGEIA